MVQTSSSQVLWRTPLASPPSPHASAAKTAEAHPKLPGTIYSAAEEIHAAGGQCLPCIVDVRDEAQVTTAVQKAVDKFGGIDIVVNNASAISLTGTLDTPSKSSTS